MDSNSTIAGGVTDQLLQCRSADWAFTALIAFIMLIVCFWQFKDELDYEIKPVVSLCFALIISIHIYLDWLSSYFNDSVAEWIIWVLITFGLATIILAAKKQWLAIAIFFYVGFPGIEVWGKLSISVAASVLFFIAFHFLPTLEKLFKTLGESLMIAVNFLVAVITMSANAGSVGWPDNCILNHYNGFMICMVRCGSVTTNNAFVHVYWLVGFAAVLAIIRMAWIRWRPGPNSVDFGKRLYCCLGCCCCCSMDPAGGEYDQLDATTKKKQNAKPKNVKRVSVNDTKKKNNGDGTTSESRGKGHVDHAVDDINLAPLDQFLDEADAATEKSKKDKQKKKNKKKRDRQRGIKPRLSGDERSDEDEDNGEIPHEVKADDSHQFVIAETDNALPLEVGEDEEDDGAGIDLEKIVRSAESKRSNPQPSPSVAITVTPPPPPAAVQEKKKKPSSVTQQQSEEAVSLV
jgi:hypothetical protein